MITLYKGINYNNSYNYIKLFSNEVEQGNYFNSLPSLIIEDKHGYIKTREYIDIKVNYDELVEEGYNYLEFTNNYKTIYAFITNKEYRNEKVTRLFYEIDVCQTYQFDFRFDNSFVERKKCTVNEITDYDEGLDIGEHIILEDNTVLFKTSKYFAMFNGFKEQELIFNDNNKLISVVDIPYNTAKPLTTIDDVQYPLYFLPLLEQASYRKAVYEDIGISSGGSQVYGDAISKKIFRFLKGYEAFASNSYVDSGGVLTKGYGITERSGYYASLGTEACTEELASRVMAEALYNGYAKPLYEQMQNDGIDMSTIRQNHFDAFLSLCYNGGLGVVIDSPMYAKFIINPNDTTVSESWGTWYIKDQLGNELQGLKDRRQAEKNIYDNNTYEYRAIGIVIDNVGTISGVVTDNNGNGYIPSELGGDL